MRVAIQIPAWLDHIEFGITNHIVKTFKYTITMAAQKV